MPGTLALNIDNTSLPAFRSKLPVGSSARMILGGVDEADVLHVKIGQGVPFERSDIDPVHPDFTTGQCGLEFVKWRMRTNETGGSELDVIMEGANLIFSR